MSSAANLYNSVINDVVNSVRECFLDESVDENVLQELKQIWTAKLDASKTIEPPPKPQDQILDAKMNKASAAAAGGASRGVGATKSAAAHAPPPPQQQQHHQGLSGGPPPGVIPPGGPAGGGLPQNNLVLDLNRIVPVQITIPAQPGNPNSQQRSLTVEVPAHALQQSGSTSSLLQSVLTQAITQALQLPESHAAVFLQNQINNAFKLG